ncbi:MAG: hypothetical protein ACQEVA_11970 [Myxococcota bacterium]
MDSTIGRTIKNRIGWGRWVAASVDTHIDRIAVELAGTGGLDEAEWTKVLAGQRDDIVAANESLYAAEAKLAKERADDGRWRIERDEAALEMYGGIVRARTLVESSDNADTTRFGMPGTTPQVASNLLPYARNAVESLRDMAEPLGTLGASIASEAIADDLQPSLDRLRAAVEAMDAEERQAEAAIVARDVALDDWERIYRAVARVLEGLYRRAGEDELADRIRPTMRRASGVDDPEDSEDDVEPVVGGGDEPLEPAEPVEPVEPVEPAEDDSDEDEPIVAE